MNTWLKTIVLLAVLAGSAAADLVDKEVSTLRLRGQAIVRGEAVTLADVLVFEQADPRLFAEIGEKPVVSDLTAPAETLITHDQVVTRLADLGVNLARVLVHGALTCRVTLEAPAAGETLLESGTAAPLIRARRLTERDASLADLLRQEVEQELADTEGRVEIEFERAGQDFLELTAPPFDFSIRGNPGQKLGLREFRVTIRQDGRVQRTVRIGAHVKLVRRVLVAARPLNVGTYIQGDSLAYATRIFSSGAELGLAHPEPVIGQCVKNFLPTGQMLSAGDLKAVDLVRRSQPVTLIGGDTVSVRITGDALDSGGYGDTIRVRIGDSRKNRREIRGVVTGPGTVRFADAGS